METLTAFFVVITLGGTDVSHIGPMPDGGACAEFKNTVSREIEESHKNDTPYGYWGGQWGVNQIIRWADTEISCAARTADVKTGEIVREQRFY